MYNLSMTEGCFVTRVGVVGCAFSLEPRTNVVLIRDFSLYEEACV